MAATQTSPAPGGTAPLREKDPIDVRGISLDVRASHGDNWFPLVIGDSETYTVLGVTLFLRRTELRALRDRLDAIDAAFPESQP